ncbi:hypothetical protein MPSEU_000355900 [Mayamaea pseudoterrestris]|nr:hypothetical protein MPSEU_000355900 [Mayamaea pseudoterrestris]
MPMTPSAPVTSINPYHLLQLRRDATLVEITQAYRKLALWHHPSRRVFAMPQAEAARRREIFEQLAASYETLMDKDARFKLDHLLLKEKALPMLSPGESRCVTVNKSMTNAICASRCLSQRQDTSASVSASPPSLLQSALSNSSFASQGSASDDHIETDAAIEAASTRSLALCSPSTTSDSTTKSIFRQSNRHISRRAVLKRVASLWNKRFARTSHSHNHNDPADASNDIQPALSSASSDSTCSDTEEHFSETETNRLFGGPLQLLFRARRWKPFGDPLHVFAQAFNNRAWELAPINHASFQDLQHPSANSNLLRKSLDYSGPSIIRRNDGCTQLTTTRTLHDRKLVRREICSADASCGKRVLYVTVTSEPLEDELLVSGMLATICGMELSHCFPCGNVT